MAIIQFYHHMTANRSTFAMDDDAVIVVVAASA